MAIKTFPEVAPAVSSIVSSSYSSSFPTYQSYEITQGFISLPSCFVFLAFALPWIPFPCLVTLGASQVHCSVFTASLHLTFIVVWSFLYTATESCRCLFSSTFHSSVNICFNMFLWQLNFLKGGLCLNFRLELLAHYLKYVQPSVWSVMVH